MPRDLTIRQVGSIAELDLLVADCRACPRLVAWRELVAAGKRAAFRNETYWGRAVPGFGPDDAWLLVVGLAPAAHGANRTGRMFTGDRSGDVLYAALYRAGLASQPHSVAVDDGLELSGVRITAPVHCAPPDNKPTPDERDNCAPFLARELELLAPTVRVALVLGGFGWQALLAGLNHQGWSLPRPRPRFRHGAEVSVLGPAGQRLTILGCYHVSQQNTFTGRLTPQMLDAVLSRATEIWYERYMAARTTRSAKVFGPGTVAAAELLPRERGIAAWSAAKRLSLLIAVGIGLHNFAEGLAIGQSAASGQVALAALLVIGFGLHNATEGFGIVAPLAGDTDAAGQPRRPSWGFLLAMGAIGGGPTFIGAAIGHNFTSEPVSVAFLTLAAGSIIYVVTQLLGIAAKAKRSDLLAYGLLLGLFAGFITDAIVTAGGA